jgi:hypothetical protein
MFKRCYLDVMVICSHNPLLQKGCVKLTQIMVRYLYFRFFVALETARVRSLLRIKQFHLFLSLMDRLLSTL